MLGQELKTIRIKTGYSQADFGKLLGATMEEIFKYEHDYCHIPSSIEEALDKILIKNYPSVKTDKVFSRDLFLKDMLTGNEVVDNIYKEAKWLKDYDGKRLQAIGATTLLKKFEKTEEKITRERVRGQEYFFINNNSQMFICKEEWIK